jgi:hypothetical protein
MRATPAYRSMLASEDAAEGPPRLRRGQAPGVAGPVSFPLAADANAGSVAV